MDTARHKGCACIICAIRDRVSKLEGENEGLQVRLKVVEDENEALRVRLKLVEDETEALNDRVSALEAAGPSP